MKKRKKKLLTWIHRFWIPLVFLVLPLFVIYSSGPYEWFARIVVISIVFLVGSVVLFWYGLSPKTQMIKAGAKLNRREFSSKTRKRVTLLARIFFCSMGLIISILTVQFYIGTALLLCGHKPVRVSGYVRDNHTLWGTWFVYQNIRLEDDTGIRQEYSLYYSAKPRLHLNKKYEFVVLPRSQFILETRESPQGLNGQFNGEN